MSEEKKSTFKVSDRRKFTVEGDVRPDAPPESSATATPEPPVAEIRPEVTHPKTPTAEEREESHSAYRDSTASLDAELHEQYGPEISKEIEANFGRLVEPFYVTALMQLGLMGQEGPKRQVDIVGARQTIDTITLLHDKMKGNLSPEEENFIQTILYQLRLSYVDVSNAIARAAQAPPGEASPDLSNLK
jgi:hypothetical protein